MIGTQPRWWAIGLPVTMAVVAGFIFYVASNEPAITVAAALLALVMFGGLSVYVGHRTKSHSSTASSSGVNGFLVLIVALAAASQVTYALEAPAFVPVGLVIVMGVVAVADQLVRRDERRRVQEESASDVSETDKWPRLGNGERLGRDDQ